MSSTTAVVRFAVESDADAIAAIYAPFCELNAVSFENVAPTPDEIASRIRAIGARWPWLVLEEGGVVAGYAYAGRHRERAAYAWAVDTAIYVGEGRRRRGIGRALYTPLFELLRMQGHFKAYAGITLPNPGSVGVHEAMGFTLVGIYRGVGYKMGEWRDVAWYGASLQPERPNPPAPRSISDVADLVAWRRTVSVRGDAP